MSAACSRSLVLRVFFQEELPLFSISLFMTAFSLCLTSYFTYEITPLEVCSSHITIAFLLTIVDLWKEGYLIALVHVKSKLDIHDKQPPVKGYPLHRSAFFSKTILERTSFTHPSALAR